MISQENKDAFPALSLIPVLLLVLRCVTDEDKLAAAMTAGALVIIVLLFEAIGEPVDASSSLNCNKKMVEYHLACFILFLYGYN